MKVHGNRNVEVRNFFSHLVVKKIQEVVFCELSVHLSNRSSINECDENYRITGVCQQAITKLMYNVAQS